MTEPPDTPSDRPETLGGATENPSFQPAAGRHSQPSSPYQPGPYSGAYQPAPSYSAYPTPPRSPKNGLAIASLVIAIGALAFVWSVVGGAFLGIIAMVMGFIARGRVKRGEATNGGVAIAGIVLGVLAVIVSMIFIAIWAGLWKEVGGSDYISCMNNAGNDTDKQQQCADQFRQNMESKLSVTLTTEPSP